jgi:hypothetical protein
MALRTIGFGSLSLFAVQSRAFDVMPATLARNEDVTAAYWQSGSIAYVLVAHAGSSDLGKAAALLSMTL